MIKTFRPYSVDDGPSSGQNGQAFNRDGTGVLIGTGGSATTRFRGIDIPQGSTINSATLRIPWSGKNDVASSFNYRLYWQTHSQLSTTLSNYTYPEGAYSGGHQNGPVRTASRAAGDNTETGRIISVNLLTEFPSFKSYMEGGNWNMHDSITFSLYCTGGITGNPDIFFVGRENWNLVIDWTPPATPARTEIMNHAVNPHAQYSQDYYNPWESNSALGTYGASTTIRNTSLPNWSAGGLGVSTGWQATWPGGQKSWTNHWAFNRIEFGKWYTFSAWCYVPTGAPDVFIDFLFQTVSATVSLKNQWFKISHTFLNTIANNYLFAGIATDVPSTTSGPHLYFTKVMFTEGEEQPDYFGGTLNQTGVGTSRYTGTGEETRLYLPTLSKPSLSSPGNTSTDDSAGNLAWTNGGSNHKVTIKRSS